VFPFLERNRAVGLSQVCFPEAERRSDRAGERDPELLQAGAGKRRDRKGSGSYGKASGRGSPWEIPSG
jgi:hypothetical protein